MTRSYTIVGAGAIGGTLAVHLHLAGADVRLVDADPQHVAAVREHGLRVRSPKGELVAQLPITTPDDAPADRKSTRLNSSHGEQSRMPSSA